MRDWLAIDWLLVALVASGVAAALGIVGLAVVQIIRLSMGIA